MASRATMRASDADRDGVAERLREAATEGRLLTEELEQRLEAAFSARTYGELNAIVADLPGRRLAPRADAIRPTRMSSALAIAIAVAVTLAVIVTVVFIVTGVLAMWVLWLAAGWWFFGPRRRRLSRTSGRRSLHTCGGWNRSRGRPRGFWA
jgi:DUF1707 SHOCT-like domain